MQHYLLIIRKAFENFFCGENRRHDIQHNDILHYDVLPNDNQT